MSRFITSAVFLLAIAFRPAHAVTSEERYRIQTELGAMEGWRLAPEAILRYCNHIDPANDDARRIRYEGWVNENRDLITDSPCSSLCFRCRILRQIQLRL